MSELPPGYTLVRQDEYRPAGCPPQGSVWARGPQGVATGVYADEAQATQAAWRLYDRLARMLADAQRKDKAA